MRRRPRRRRRRIAAPGPARHTNLRAWGDCVRVRPAVGREFDAMMLAASTVWSRFQSRGSRRGRPEPAVWDQKRSPAESLQSRAIVAKLTSTVSEKDATSRKMENPRQIADEALRRDLLLRVVATYDSSRCAGLCEDVRSVSPAIWKVCHSLPQRAR